MKLIFLYFSLAYIIFLLYLCTKFQKYRSNDSSTLAEIQKFLNDFHQKVEVFDILFFDEREKNRKALAELDITNVDRVAIIKTITVEDYSEGPIKNMLNRFGDLWVFGKDVKGQEVYIKICYGVPNMSTICVSFHVAEFPMKYPYKKGGIS